jgi:putative copper export protein
LDVSRAVRAYAIAVHGAAVEDVVWLARQHLREAVLYFRQEKMGTRWRSPFIQPTMRSSARALPAATIISIAAIDHAARDTELNEALHLGAKAIHLLAAGAWLGGLVPLGYVFVKASKHSSDGWAFFARLALTRFSIVGYIAVSLVLLSGCIISAFHISGWSGLVDTSYGRVLVVKISRAGKRLALNASKAALFRAGSPFLEDEERACRD